MSNTTVDSLKQYYAKKGGNLSDVESVSTIPGMIDAITALPGGGEPGGDYVANTYKGKKVVHMGDSWVQLYGIAEGVAELKEYNVINCGFQATCISSFREPTDGAGKLSLLALATAIQNNTWTEQEAVAIVKGWDSQLATLKSVDWATVDTLILSYGVNDFSVQNPLGDTSARDEESVCGALKNAIKIFNTLNPNMEIIITTPCLKYNSPNSSTMSNYSDFTMEDEYRNAIGLTAQACAIKLIDMRALSGINEGNRSQTLLADGLHPTALGVALWVNAFSKAMENGYAGAFDTSNDFVFKEGNLCFDSEMLTKHKKWNATYTLNNKKYLCTARDQQFGHCILGKIHFDALPSGSKIAIAGRGIKTTVDAHRMGFYIKNADYSSDLLDKFTSSQFKTTDDEITYSFTTTQEYTDCWVIFYVKQMTSWDSGKALVRAMDCTVILPTT